MTAEYCRRPQVSPLRRTTRCARPVCVQLVDPKAHRVDGLNHVHSNAVVTEHAIAQDALPHEGDRKITNEQQQHTPCSLNELKPKPVETTSFTGYIKCGRRHPPKSPQRSPHANAKFAPASPAIITRLMHDQQPPPNPQNKVIRRYTLPTCTTTRRQCGTLGQHLSFTLRLQKKPYRASAHQLPKTQRDAAGWRKLRLRLRLRKMLLDHLGGSSVLEAGESSGGGMSRVP